MPVKIGVVVPVRNCLEYTRAALSSLKTRHAHRIYVIDDHSGGETKSWLADQSDLTVFTDPPGSTGLAWNWNLGISAALNDGCTHFLVINNDILLHGNSADTLIERIDRGDVVLVTGDDVAPRAITPEDVYDWTPDSDLESHHLDYSCFMLTPNTLRRIGWFDEQFAGAYYEDNDYTARVVRAGERGVRVGAAPYYHHSMRTVNGNPETKPTIQRCAAINGERFQRKWGSSPAGSPEEMRNAYYLHPFNEPTDYKSGPTPRFKDIYEQSKPSSDTVSLYSDPLYRLASTLNTATVVGDIGIGGMCAIASTGVHQLSHIGVTEFAAQTRFEAAATVHGLSYLRLDDHDAVKAESADLVVFAAKALCGEIPDLDRLIGSAGRYIVLLDDSGSIRGLNVDTDAWKCMAAPMRLHSEFRLLLGQDARYVTFRRWPSPDATFKSSA